MIRTSRTSRTSRPSRGPAPRTYAPGVGALALLLGALLLFSAPRLAWGQMAYRIPTTRADLEELCDERSFGIYESGAHVGWASESFVSTQSQGKPVFLWSYEQRLTKSLGAEAQVLVYRRREVFSAEADFRFCGGSFSAQTLVGGAGVSSRVLTQISFEIAPTRLGWTCTYEHRGKRQVEDTTWAVDYRASDRRGLRRFLRAPKASRRSYWTDREVSLDGSATSRVFRVHETTGTGEDLRVHLRSTYGPDLLATQVRDARGGLVSSREGTQELRLEPKAWAQRPVKADALAASRVPSGQKLQSLLPSPKLRFRILGPGAASFGKGPGQRSRPVPGGVEVEVDFRYGPKPTPTAYERALALQDSLEIPVSDPKIQALARQAVGSTRSPRGRIYKLVKFVSKRLRYSLERDTYSVLTTLELGEGDCTEFAALFTALARSLGIPCRRVSGLAYMGDAEQAFGWHAWCEVAVGGSWLPVDPGWGAFPPPPTHLRLCDEFSWVPSPGKLRVELPPKAKPARAREGPGQNLLPR